MNKRLKVIGAVFLETNTEAETPERALEILQVVKPILECGKQFWRGKIEDMFEEFVEGSGNPKVMAKKLHWAFHKSLFIGMCDAYQGD